MKLLLVTILFLFSPLTAATAPRRHCRTLFAITTNSLCTRLDSLFKHKKTSLPGWLLFFALGFTPLTAPFFLRPKVRTRPHSLQLTIQTPSSL
jgi:hypothetical protein